MPDPALNQEYRDHAELARQFLAVARAESGSSLDLIRAKGQHGDFDPMRTSAGRSAIALVALCQAVSLLADRVDGLVARTDRLLASARVRDYSVDWPARPEPVPAPDEQGHDARSPGLSPLATTQEEADDPDHHRLTEGVPPPPAE